MALKMIKINKEQDEDNPVTKRKTENKLKKRMSKILLMRQVIKKLKHSKSKSSLKDNKDE